MIFIPLSQFVAIWLIREVHSIVLSGLERPLILSMEAKTCVQLASITCKLHSYISSFFLTTPSSLYNVLTFTTSKFLIRITKTLGPKVIQRFQNIIYTYCHYQLF